MLYTPPWMRHESFEERQLRYKDQEAERRFDKHRATCEKNRRNRKKRRKK